MLQNFIVVMTSVVTINDTVDNERRYVVTLNVVAPFQVLIYNLSMVKTEFPDRDQHPSLLFCGSLVMLELRASANDLLLMLLTLKLKLKI
jgi:hypothetical protein